MKNNSMASPDGSHSQTLVKSRQSLPAGLVAAVVEAPSLGQLWQAALTESAEVVGLDGVRIAELVMAPIVRYRVLAQSADAPDLSGPLIRSPANHPIIANYMQTHFTNWVSLRDLLPGRQWDEHPLYREVYRPAGVRAQISCAIHDWGHAMISISLSRGGRDFNEHERERLAHLQSIMQAGYRRVLREERERSALAALDHAVSPSDLVVVISPEDGSITHVSSELNAWNRRHPGVLDHMLQIVRAGREPRPIQVGDAMVMASAVQTVQGIVLAVREAPRAPLTPREIEVLQLLAVGLSGRSIARRLGSSEGTVRKHLEHIYSKLGAHDRLAAVGLAREYSLIPLDVALHGGLPTQIR